MIFHLLGKVLTCAHSVLPVGMAFSCTDVDAGSLFHTFACQNTHIFLSKIIGLAYYNGILGRGGQIVVFRSSLFNHLISFLNVRFKS